MALLETKFHAPRTHGRLVARDRLRALIEQGTRGALTLVSAPAGFGKSTLMAEAAADGSTRAAVAWLSLDRPTTTP